MAALEKYHGGPRSLLVQLCLALSGLALQFPAWKNPVQDMIDSFGRNPATVPTLLQFLTVLPEELTSNTRIPVTVLLRASNSSSTLMSLAGRRISCKSRNHPNKQRRNSSRTAVDVYPSARYAMSSRSVDELTLAL